MPSQIIKTYLKTHPHHSTHPLIKWFQNTFLPSLISPSKSTLKDHLLQLNWKATKSSGPGGQHVNCTNSRAELRISCTKFPLEIFKTLDTTNLPSSMSLCVYSQQQRHFAQNQNICRQLMADKVAKMIIENVLEKDPINRHFKDAQIKYLKTKQVQKRLALKQLGKAKKESRRSVKNYFNQSESLTNQI